MLRELSVAEQGCRAVLKVAVGVSGDRIRRALSVRRQSVHAARACLHIPGCRTVGETLASVGRVRELRQ